MTFNLNMNKPKIAIFDFTDCEGCEVQIINLKEKLMNFLDYVDVINWRLGQTLNFKGPYDVALIEGTPIRPAEIEQLKSIRKKSKILIALGACATLGGIPAIIEKEERESLYKKIYGADYKPVGTDAQPLSKYVEIDYLLHGCPVSLSELERVLGDLLLGKKPKPPTTRVCFECKLNENPCRLLEKKICLGPITRSGCNAICVTSGSPCYGCLGPASDAAVDNLKQILTKFASDEEIEKSFEMFLNRKKEVWKI